MKITELINSLQEIKDSQGNCDIVIDYLESRNFIYDFDIVGEYYTFNNYNNGKPINRCFIVFYKGEE